jgi:tRNA N6-adenosine threonylcarbamoyltransferase
MKILGIESSCDETSAAVLSDGQILSNIISSQIVHQKYGGIVPELASRAHQQMIIPVVAQALKNADINLKDLNGVAVTYGPGLMGSLLVGVSFAKSLAYGLDIPFIGVNHMEAHIYSNFIDEPRPDYPFLCLTVSGGHTQLVHATAPLKHHLLGETLDDAAGEAFDKVAKMLGLGFPGGPKIDNMAKQGNPKFVKFPRSYLGGNIFDFSFSGIKTSVMYWLRDHGYHQKDNSPELIPSLLADLCASFQDAVVEVLVDKTVRAVYETSVKDVALSGGVSANSELRRQMTEASKKNGFRLFIPDFQYCTDNGAMIAYLGWMKLRAGERSGYELSASANLSLSEIR